MQGPAPLDDDIARKAYELWEVDGRPHGRDADHWALARERLTAADSNPRVDPSPSLDNLHLAVGTAMTAAVVVASAVQVGTMLLGLPLASALVSGRRGGKSSRKRRS